MDVAGGQWNIFHNNEQRWPFFHTALHKASIEASMCSLVFLAVCVCVCKRMPVTSNCSYSWDRIKNSAASIIECFFVRLKWCPSPGCVSVCLGGCAVAPAGWIWGCVVWGRAARHRPVCQPCPLTANSHCARTAQIDTAPSARSPVTCSRAGAKH